MFRRVAPVVPMLVLGALALGQSARAEVEKSRLVMFVGVDISGSFIKGKHFDDALKFTAHYLSTHLNGYGGLESPSALFVGSIGGAKKDEPKTFYPIQTFENKSPAEIEAKLHELFPKDVTNPFTDFNSYFDQVATFVQNKNLTMRPISVVLISDGLPDTPTGPDKHDYKSIKLEPLEFLTRNVTLRLLYTTAEIGMKWQKVVKRQRVRVWTQDDTVMALWREPKIFMSDKPLVEQKAFFAWVKDNVDFPVRTRRVD